MKATVRLFIRLSNDGEPLPTLGIEIGDDTYRVFDGKPIKGWRKGRMTGHSTSIDIASQPEIERPVGIDGYTYIGDLLRTRDGTVRFSQQVEMIPLEVHGGIEVYMKRQSGD